MKFGLDEPVFYKGEIMRVWDFSVRTQKYQLIGIDNTIVSDVSEKEIEEETNEGFRTFAFDISRRVNFAKQDIEIGGYGFLRDLGQKIYEAYEYGLLTSHDFLFTLAKVIANDNKSNN